MAGSDSDNEKTRELESHSHFHKLDRQYPHRPTWATSDKAWYAYDDTTGRECIWNTKSATNFSEAAWANLEARLQLLTQMKHSNICQFMDYWATAGPNGTVQITFITEVMTSGNLRRYLVKSQKAKTTPQVKVIQRWCRQILSALHMLHSNGITHGNLSLDTVYIQHNGLIKVGDIWLGDLQKHVNIRTMRDEAMNTYWAPELFEYHGENEDDLPPSIDVYAFGLLVLEMVTGEALFKECNSFADIYLTVRNGTLPEALGKVANLELRDMVACCLNPVEIRPTAYQLLGHRFLFEVPPLRVFAAHYILKNDFMALCQGDKRMSAEDLNFLYEVDAGAWGSLANVRPQPEQERRRTASNATLYVFLEPAKTPNTGWSLLLLIHLNDGMRRMVSCDFNPMEEKPGTIVDELVAEGLLNAADRSLWTRAIEARVREASVGS